MTRTSTAPAALGTALLLGLGLAACGDEVDDGTVVEEVTDVSTETETEVVEDVVTVEPTATVTETDEEEVEVEVTETETEIEFDPEATQELSDIEATLEP
ncbi:hypothetical protein [Aquipuribacter sp. SD81]|uniref:hypothetical protein n=1 Tax=Aquipuribacter sp. SD81 TaxID=3127703 RepID=UPI003019B794